MSSSPSADENEVQNSFSTLYSSVNTPEHQHDSGYFSSPSPSPSTFYWPTRRFLSSHDYENYVTQRKHLDIFTELDERSIFHVIDQILSGLSTADRRSCSKVSRTWHWILKDFRHRHPTSDVKRNLFHSHHRKKSPPLSSTPMQNKTNLLDVAPSAKENATPEKNLRLAASSMTCRYNYLKYLHGPTVPKRCPICAYVSIVDVNDQHG